MIATIPLALYVHLPWCVRKCPYCDFNSYEAPGVLPTEAYVDALLRDLDADLLHAQGRALESIFIGGGTPSLFPAQAIQRLLDGVRARLALARDVEITLEANPGAVDEAHFHGYRAAGVNRLSIGVQSLRAAQLRALGRIHGPDDVLHAIETARAAGFDNLNLDLMHGLPGDGPGDSVRELDALLRLAPTHVSWYQLTLEEGTAFAHQPPTLPDDDQIVADFEQGLARLAAAGFSRYEVSAYAMPGRASRHNLNYWTFGDYLGIGAGAHGKWTASDGVYRSARRRHPNAYLQQAGTPTAGTVERVPEDALTGEFMLNALRLRDGFGLELFETRTGLPREGLAVPLAQAVAKGWLVERVGHVTPTEAGYRFLNDLQILFLDVAPHAARAVT